MIPHLNPEEETMLQDMLVEASRSSVIDFRPANEGEEDIAWDSLEPRTGFGAELEEYEGSEAPESIDDADHHNYPPKFREASDHVMRMLLCTTSDGLDPIIDTALLLVRTES